MTLFNIAPNHYDPEQIDPLLLRLVPMSFHRMPADNPGDVSLYFIVDSAASLVLYVGETCRSNKRWKGIHAC
ncbi:MAG: GIY-YIG nuclease family protein, partial [Nostoc sp.]